MTPRAVEQVFLERSGGGTTVLLVLEDEAGGRTRERMPLPVPDFPGAARQVARRLAQRGVVPAGKLRLRVRVGGELKDDEGLRQLFLDELNG